MADDVGIYADGLPVNDSADSFLGVKIDDDGIADLVRVDIDKLIDDVAQSVGSSIQTDRLLVSTWTALNGIVGSFAHQGAEVYGDAGTHTDPITSATGVPNSGVFSYVTGTPNGWTYLSADAISTKAPLNYVGVKGGKPHIFGYGSAFNGASVIYDESNVNVVGISVPNGSTGNSSFFAIQVPLYGPDFQRLGVGNKTIELTLTMEATAGFLAAAPFVALAVETPVQSGTHAGTVVGTSQVGTTITRVVQYTVQGTETSLGIGCQLDVSAIFGANGSIQFSDLSWRVVDVPSTDAAEPGADSVFESIKTFAALRTGIVCSGDVVMSDGVAFNGASLTTGPDGRQLGWSIPSGQTGFETYLTFGIPIGGDIDLLENAWVRIKLGFTTSEDYPAGLGAFFKLRDAAGTVSFATDTTVFQAQVSSTRRVIELVGKIVASPVPVQLLPTIQTVLNAAVPSTATITLTDAVFEIIAGVSDTRSEGDDNTYLAAMHARRAATQRVLGLTQGPQPDGYDETRYIESGGAGNYTSLTAALADISDADFTNRYELELAAETFTDFNVAMKSFIDVRGADRARSIIAGAQPADASLADITNNSTLRCVESMTLSDLMITVKNGRYGIHCDFGGSPNHILILNDLTIIHEGNQEARDHQTAIGGNPGGVWVSEYAIGPGFASGVEFRIRRCTFVGGLSDSTSHALNGHDNTGMTAPGKMLIEDSKLLVRTPNSSSAMLGCLGGQCTNAITLNRNLLNAPVGMFFTPWLPTDAASQLANKVHMEWRGAGNSPVPFIIIDDGSRALRIDSATTGKSSSVAISGTAAAVLFGDVVTVAGDVGLAGAAYGTWDVGDHLVGPNSDQAITSLAFRLGNRTSVPITLTVTIDGGSPINITFNTNYSTTPNATIEGLIQTAIGSAGIVSEFNVNDLYRPSFTDEEMFLQNSDTTTIRRKTAVKFDGTQIGGKVMIQSDAASTFAGIATEDIRPGQWGRIKTRGCVRVAMDMIRSDSGSFTAGTNFGVGSVAGQFVASPSIALLQSINAADVRWLATTKPFV